MAVDLNYGIGVEGKNLILKTLGRVYVKVKDRKYELIFRPEDIRNQIESYLNKNNNDAEFDFASILNVPTSDYLNSMEYPGDNVFIITTDGKVFITSANKYVEVPLQFTTKDLTLDSLIINNQLTLGSNTLLTVANKNKIYNLNADYLDDHSSEEFAIKKNNETISGNWSFTGNLEFQNTYCRTFLSDPNNTRIYINFDTGKITCLELETEKLIVPNTINENAIGLGQEAWVGLQIPINGIQETNQVIKPSKIDYISKAFEAWELPHMSYSETNVIQWPLEEFWYSKIFFDSYDLTTYEYVLKDFQNVAVRKEVASNFDGTTYSLNSFRTLIDALYNPSLDEFQGSNYQIDIPEETKILTILPNAVIKFSNGVLGVVVDRDGAQLFVKLQNIDDSLEDVSYFVIIGSIINKGGICLNSNSPSFSVLKNNLDLSSANVYLGELSKFDINKSGVGAVFKGSYPQTIVTNNQIDVLQNYIHTSEIDIQNPYIKWGESISVLNEDGSGYLSQGQIRWSANKDLIIEDSEISQSSFKTGIFNIAKDGSGNIGTLIEFTTSNITLNSPLGPAGGDLSGNYPNPTLKEGVILEKHLSPEVLDMINTNTRSSLMGIQSNLEARVNNLESLVEKLNITLENHLKED